MARHIFQSVFKDGQGRIIPSATVSVYLAGTVTTANVYSAATGGSPVTSVTTASDGSFAFYVSDSDFSLNQKFKITMTKTDFATKSYDNITIFAPVPTGIFYPDANATDQGAATTGGYSLKDIIDAAGSNNITIKFRNSSGSATTSYTLTTSETIPSNCAIEIEIGAKIVQGGSATLTVSGHVVGNPKHQWLSGFVAGEVLISSMPELLAIWLGTTAASINKAISASSGNGDVKLLPGVTSISETVNVSQPSVNLIGSSRGSASGTILEKSADGISKAIFINSLYGGIKELSVDCNNKTLDGILVTGGNHNVLSRVRILNAGGTGWGLVVSDASHNRYYDISTVNCYNGISVEGTGSSNFQQFYGCSAGQAETSDGTCVRVYSSGNIIHSIWFFGLLIEPGVGRALYVVNASGSGVTNLYLEAAYISTHDLIEISGANCNSFKLSGGLISASHASFAKSFIVITGGAVNTEISNLYLMKTSNDTTAVIHIDNAIGALINNITTYITTNHLIVRTTSSSKGVVINNLQCTGGGVPSILMEGTGHKIYGGSDNITLTIATGASDIIIENFTGDIAIEAGTANVKLTNCTGTITGAGAGIAIIINNQQAANADTSGATLGQLETEVNELKSVLRSLGLITT